MKNSRKYAFLMAVAVIASSLMLCGCEKKDKNESENSVIYYNTSDDNAEQQNNDDNSEADETEKAENKNDNSKADNENVEVQYVDCNVEEQADSNGISVNMTEIKYLDKKKTTEDTKLLYCMFDIKNVTDSSIGISSLDNFSVSVDGQEPKMEAVASLKAVIEASNKFGADKKLNGEITSGNSASGYLAFEIPANAAKIQIEYHPHKALDNSADDTVFKYAINIDDIK